MAGISLLATESTTTPVAAAGPRLVAIVPLLGAAAIVGLAVGGIRSDLGLGAAAAVAIVAAVAGRHDAHTGRIPNRYVLAALGVVGVATLLLVLTGERAIGDVLADHVAALLLSGAPLLFLVWFVVPALVGGGDWKLLGALGLALGLTAPLAVGALIVLMFGSVLGDAVARRRRHVFLGPHLAVAYAFVVALLVWSPSWLDGVLS